jgi:hypothetical protein
VFSDAFVGTLSCLGIAGIGRDRLARVFEVWTYVMNAELIRRDSDFVGYSASPTVQAS